MSAAWTIARHYLFAGADSYSRFITWVSFVGLLLGVLVLTVVVSVMNGFDDALKTRLLTAIPHVVVDTPNRDEVASLDLPHVNAVFSYFEGIGMVGRGNAVTPVSIFALDRAGIGSPSEIRAHVLSGSLDRLQSDPRGIVLGAPLAAHLGVVVGDSLSVIFPVPEGTGIAPVQKRFRLAATFELGAELDVNLALLSLEGLDATILQSTGQVATQIRLDDPLRAAEVAQHLSSQYDDDDVSTWMIRYGALFSAVQLEKSMMFVILLLVVAVAAFNIASGQYMLVRKKTAAIAILRTMGATAGFVSRIFLLQGLLIGIVGIAAGLLLGVLAALNIDSIVAFFEAIFEIRFLDGTYFVTIPVQIEALDLAIIGAMSAVICLLAAYFPARRARNQSPVDGLHGL